MPTPKEKRKTVNTKINDMVSVVENQISDVCLRRNILDGYVLDGLSVGQLRQVNKFLLSFKE